MNTPSNPAEIAPDGVQYSEAGEPDLLPFQKDEVCIELTRSRATNAQRAEKAMRARYGDSWERPDGFIWHEERDCKTMRLVPSALHDEVPHTGGFAVVQESAPKGTEKFQEIIERTHRPVTPREIVEYERINRLRILPEHAALLCLHNGGNVRGHEVATGDGTSTSGIAFLGIHPEAKWCDIADRRRALDGWGDAGPPDYLLPLASDAFGNFFCVAVNGAQMGSIWFWAPDNNPRNLRVFESLHAFIDGIVASE